MCEKGEPFTRTGGEPEVRVGVRVRIRVEVGVGVRVGVRARVNPVNPSGSLVAAGHV